MATLTCGLEGLRQRLHERADAAGLCHGRITLRADAHQPAEAGGRALVSHAVKRLLAQAAHQRGGAACCDDGGYYVDKAS